MPLVGVAIWAAERVVQANSECAFAFPRYNQSDVTVANSASAALNQWLKKDFNGLTAHGLRHTFRDRLRAVECPMDMIDQIGGWKSVSSIGNSYGQGFTIERVKFGIFDVQI